MIGRIFLGLVIAAVGYFMVAKTQFFLDLGGSIDWAEKTFGGGGSRLFYKLLGIAVIIIGFLVVTNLFEMVVGGFIMSVFG